MPRKPKRHNNPSRAIHNRTADPKRTERRLQTRIQFMERLSKEKTIGVDPRFDHARGLSETARVAAHMEWKKRSDEYDKRMKVETGIWTAL